MLSMVLPQNSVQMKHCSLFSTVRPETLTALTMKTAAFWNVMLCSMVASHNRVISMCNISYATLTAFHSTPKFWNNYINKQKKGHYNKISYYLQ